MKKDYKCNAEDEQIVEEFLNHFEDLKTYSIDLEYNVDRKMTKNEAKLLQNMTKCIQELYEYRYGK